MGEKAQHVAIFLIHLCMAVNADYDFYVSVDGSDLWDGSAETNVDGSDVGPWKTLNHAVDEIRKAREHPTYDVSKSLGFIEPLTVYDTPTYSGTFEMSQISYWFITKLPLLRVTIWSGDTFAWSQLCYSNGVIFCGHRM